MRKRWTRKAIRAALRVLFFALPPLFFMDIYDPSYIWPPPPPVGGEGGQSGGGGASGSWGSSGCQIVAVPHDQILAEMLPYVGAPAGDGWGIPAEQSDGSFTVWAGLYLYYQTTGYRIYTSENGHFDSARRGTLITKYETERLCEGTIIGGLDFSYSSDYAYDKYINRFLGSGLLWWADEVGGWYTLEEFYTANQKHGPYVSECAQQCVYSLMIGMFAYPTPFLTPHVLWPFLPLFLGVPSALAPVITSELAAIFAEAAAAPATRKKRRLTS